VPTFHREGESANLRKLEIGGVKGRFLHEIFDANKAIEFPRDKFGPISERIHGHAFAAKTFAIRPRGSRQDGLAAVDDPKFFRMETVADTGPIDKQIERRLEKLPEELRRVLSRLAPPADPGRRAARLSNELGVSRNARLELLSLGLLEICGTEEDRRYRVHPDRADAARLARGGRLRRVRAAWPTCTPPLAKTAQGLQKLAYEQEQDRFAVAGPRHPACGPRLELPDHDMAPRDGGGAHPQQAAPASDHRGAAPRRGPQPEPAQRRRVAPPDGARVELGRGRQGSRAIEPLFEEAPRQGARARAVSSRW
jgi:hypothetical protein